MSLSNPCWTSTTSEVTSALRDASHVLHAVASECLPDAEVEGEVRAGIRVWILGAIQPVPEVGANGPDAREQAQAEANRPVEIHEVDVLSRIDDVAAVEERHRGEPHALDVREQRAELEVRFEQLRAADRHDALVTVDVAHQLRGKPALAEAALARRAAREIALGDRDVSIEPSAPRAHGKRDRQRRNWHVTAQIGRA